MLMCRSVLELPDYKIPKCDNLTLANSNAYPLDTLEQSYQNCYFQNFLENS